MKTMFGLSGAGNKGKSTTIQILREILNENGFEIIDFSFKVIFRGKDFCMIFEKDGIKIGICSYGDTDEILKKWLPILIDEGCSIIICACRTYGATKDYLNSLKSKKVKLEIIDKSTSKIEKEHLKLNKSDAQKLFKLILENMKK